MPYTKAQLVEMWKRPVVEQYNIMVSKIFEAITQTNGDITICFSGGKDSCLILDMYCDIYVNLWGDLRGADFDKKPIKVVFANTTNETSAMLKFIPDFIKRCEEKYGVTIDFIETRPEVPWAKVILEEGLPLISKEQAKYIRVVKKEVNRLGLPYEDVLRLYKGGEPAVKELKALGMSSSAILNLTGYVTKRDAFGQRFILSKVWLPMIECPIDLSEKCCIRVKENPLSKITGGNIMTGEQAKESKQREMAYMKTGCNSGFPDNNSYRSKPLGPMTLDGILFAITERDIPICPDYGQIIKDEKGCYGCTNSTRTGCALCGFGCQYDTKRFVRLQETEPAKVKFAFKPKAEGGAGYLEAITYMNEHCGTNVEIPKV